MPGHGWVGAVLSLLFLCACATDHSLRPPLPPEVSMNEEAGRGGWLMVSLRLDSGEDVPMLLDSGASGTVIDKTFQPKLGKPVGTLVARHWGVKTTHKVYAAPRLFWGGVPLQMTGQGIITDDCRPLSADARRPVLGVLGMDVLEHYCLQLDFVAGKIRFLDDERADKQTWGRAFPMVALNLLDPRPAVRENLLGVQGPPSLIDIGFTGDGWLMPNYYQQWTNQAAPTAKGEAHSPDGRFGGVTYPWVSLAQQKVESDGIGLRFFARHLVTLDFPKRTLYLQRQSPGPLSDPELHTTRMPALEALTQAVVQGDTAAARAELVRINHSPAPELTKTIARKLAATLERAPRPVPADVPRTVAELPLGDARPDRAEVGWLQPAANRIPLNAEIESPLLDSGKIYATGLFAHAPSRYVYDLGGQWKTLRGQAGLHTAFQGHAFGVVFVIKTDGREVFRSAVIHDSIQPRYALDVTGVKTLELLVEPATDQNGGNWGLWLDPTLFRDSAPGTGQR